MLVSPILHVMMDTRMKDWDVIPVWSIPANHTALTQREPMSFQRRMELKMFFQTIPSVYKYTDAYANIDGRTDKWIELATVSTSTFSLDSKGGL